eukprot:GGOE01031319.1.p2 GENE.GGOE01031319.1~~GGOE01031319.1.p2  ORF type:complete len:101 (-),score=4.63 GGOE01031319.1:239-541(-)
MTADIQMERIRSNAEANSQKGGMCSSSGSHSAISCTMMLLYHKFSLQLGGKGCQLCGSLPTFGCPRCPWNIPGCPISAHSGDPEVSRSPPIPFRPHPLFS